MYIAISRQSCKIYSIFVVPYYSYGKSHKKGSESIYQLALGRSVNMKCQYERAKKNTCTNIHAFVAKRAMWWLRAFCREMRYVKFTRIFRLLKNIVYRVHLARLALYRVHIAWSLQKNIAQGWSQQSLLITTIASQQLLRTPLLLLW